MASPWGNQYCAAYIGTLSFPLHTVRDVLNDRQQLVYHSDRQALSTARFRRAGSLATADTRLVNFCDSRPSATLRRSIDRDSLSSGRNLIWTCVPDGD